MMVYTPLVKKIAQFITENALLPNLKNFAYGVPVHYVWGRPSSPSLQTISAMYSLVM